MLKRIFALGMAVVLTLGMAACGEKTDTASGSSENNWKIGIMTGTVSQNEEEYRSAQNVQAKYGAEHVILTTYPDQFMKEQETLIQNVVTMASDKEVKAIIINQAVPGTAAAIDKCREIRDDLLFSLGLSRT